MSRLGLSLALALAIGCTRAGPADAGPAGTTPPTPNSAPTVVAFEPFGPTPGTTGEQLASWSALVAERFLGEPDEARRAELDALLAALHPVDATPAFLNAVRGLDMGVGRDVLRAAELTAFWFVAQSRVMQLVLHEPEDLTAVSVRNRLAQLDGWARWWGRKLGTSGSLESYRAQVDELRAFVERDRRQRRVQG